MSRGKSLDNYSGQDETGKVLKMYRFELSAKRLFAYAFCLLLSLCWMFVFGILIGRGMSFENSKDVSWRSQFLQFLGLTRVAEPMTEKAAETWEDPKKMLESLSYYEDLTQKQKSGPLQSTAKTGTTSGSHTAPAPTSSTSEHKTKPIVTADKSGPSIVPQQNQNSPDKTPDEPAPSPPKASSEHFTLLVSSLREIENAQHLLEQLRAKGYSPRIETLELSGSGRWNRILIGSFRSREEATRFAADFNRRERMEGLVVREGD